MTVIRTAKATCRSTPYPYQSSISRLYRRRRRASLTMNYSSAEIRATPAAVIPPFEDVYFDSNGVLFRNGIAIVDQRGSIIRRSIVERPLPTLVAPEALGLRSNWAILGHAAHRITPPVYDPYPAFVESRSIPPAFPAYPRGPVPPGLESLPEHLRHNGPGLTPLQGANSLSEDAQDIIVDHFYNTTAPPAPCSASEPCAPTTDLVDTDSDPADAQSEPLLTNDQGNPTTIDLTTIKSTTSLGAITSQPNSIVSPLVLSILPISTNPPCLPWCQTTPNSLLATEPSAPIACRPSSSSPAAIIHSIELCAANNLWTPTGLSTTSYEI
ncbi:hypothetical protein PCANC_28224 [Puccinia coronata f. sp. avenae]|uniref:Uncharacterized protein n=1 Tax=Puccinia coronata f. sp. avenae TaxID=200324 RepID=A0A2N5RV64_9BASI|nr:hypothetical protein PCANC_28224 [Puccinia coronata f. sp. avenae]